MKIFDGFSITVSQDEVKIFSLAPLSSLVNAFVEHQSRALVIGRLLGHELLKVQRIEKLEAKIASLKQQLSSLTMEKRTLSS